MEGRTLHKTRVRVPVHGCGCGVVSVLRLSTCTVTCPAKPVQYVFFGVSCLFFFFALRALGCALCCCTLCASSTCALQCWWHQASPDKSCLNTVYGINFSTLVCTRSTSSQRTTWAARRSTLATLRTTGTARWACPTPACLHSNSRELGHVHQAQVWPAQEGL